jgi:Na+/H+ antiporter NhaD/arsenite permease-like protein
LAAGGKEADRVQQTFADVEWSTIFFFIGLFVVVHAVEVSSVLKTVAEKFLALTGGRIATAGSLILWVSAILSAIVAISPSSQR